MIKLIGIASMLLIIQYYKCLDVNFDLYNCLHLFSIIILAFHFLVPFNTETQYRGKNLEKVGLQLKVKLKDFCICFYFGAVFVFSFWQKTKPRHVKGIISFPQHRDLKSVGKDCEQLIVLYLYDECME